MSAQQAIRVVIVDDHPLAQSGMRNFVAAFPDLRLVGTAGSGEEALEVVERERPDVTLMDMLMPGMGGVEATRQIRQRYPKVQVIALTSSQDGELVRQVVQAGAISYLLKSVSALELAQAIRAAHAGRSVLAPEAAGVLLDSLRGGHAPGHDLSEREREVLQLVAQGLSNLQIAQQLSISRSTVKFHLSSIFSKLGVSNRPALIALAYQHHLVS
jgi:two-component system, NarL family, response regulator LiaR